MPAYATAQCWPAWAHNSRIYPAEITVCGKVKYDDCPVSINDECRPRSKSLDSTGRASLLVAMPFAHLHTHTEYSFLDGRLRITDLVETAKNAGMTAVAITDRTNLYGAYGL